MLWIRKLSDSKALAVAGTDGAQQPFWSPDSKTIGFFAQNRLKRVEAAGGPVTSLADITIDPRGGAWMPDQTIVYAPSNHSGLWRVAAAGGASEPLECSTDLFGFFPSALPDGKRVLFVVRHNDPAKRGIYVGPVRGGKAERLLASEMSGIYAEPGYLLYPAGGMLIARSFKNGTAPLTEEPFFVGPGAGSSNAYASLSVSATGVLARGDALIAAGYPTWFTRNGAEEESIGNIGDYSDFRISPDGRRILVSLNEGDTGMPKIWLHDLHRGTASKQTSEVHIVASPVWSPKGDYFVYRTNRGGVMDLRKRDLASGQVSDVFSADQRQANGDSGNYVPADISADGKHLIYTAAGRSGYDVYTMPLDGAGLPRKLVATANNEMHANISPDGRWVAYSSDESGQFQVYVQSFATGDRKEQVSADGGSEPRWRGDGGELYYLSPDQMLMAVPFRHGDPGKPVELFKAKTPAEVNPFRQRYIPSADGQRFLVYTVDPSERAKPITVTVNWLGSIKR